MDGTDFEKFVKKALHYEDAAGSFRVKVELSINDLEELRRCVLSAPLQALLAVEYRKATEAYARSKMDFGDLEED